MEDDDVDPKQRANAPPKGVTIKSKPAKNHVENDDGTENTGTLPMATALSITLANILQNVVDNLRDGNFNIDTDQFNLIASFIQKITSPQNDLLSTYEAIRYFNVSRRMFYTVIRPLLKGEKRPGQKTILYSLDELQKLKRILQSRPNQPLTHF